MSVDTDKVMTLPIPTPSAVPVAELDDTLIIHRGVPAGTVLPIAPPAPIPPAPAVARPVDALTSPELPAVDPGFRLYPAWPERAPLGTRSVVCPACQLPQLVRDGRQPKPCCDGTTGGEAA